MRVRYDEEVDVLYIRLKETPYYESDEIKEGIIIDYDKDGNVIGIEIMNATEYLAPEELSTIKFDITRKVSLDQKCV
jgi:uncharacterized protein YuzE